MRQWPYLACGLGRTGFLVATGSEVSLIVDAQRELEEQNVAVRLVSMPIWELFDAQPEEYRHSVFPRSIPAGLAVEAGLTQGRRRYVGAGAM